jgi:hypothetical protein
MRTRHSVTLYVQHITCLVGDKIFFRAGILGVYPNAPLSLPCATLTWQKMFQMTTIFDSHNLGVTTR